MKKKLFSILILPAVLLSSCSWFGVASSEKVIDVYDIDKLDATNNLSSGFQKAISARIANGEGAIPYLTLNQYAHLYDSHLKPGFYSKVEKYRLSMVWEVYKEKEDDEESDTVCFVSQINYVSKTIATAGSLQYAFKDDDDPRDMKALNYGLKTTQTGKPLGSYSYATYYYSNYNFKTIASGGEMYFPLGLLDITYSDDSGIYFTYNYAHIISTHDVDNYKDKKYIDNGTEYTFNSQMKANKPSEKMPSYLREYNAYLLFYLIDHLYGLKNEKNVYSAANFYKNSYRSIYNALFSDTDETRVLGYCDALSVLDDNHTILYSVNDTWSDGTYTRMRRNAERCYQRSQLNGKLTGYRDKAYLQYHKENGDGAATPGVDIVYSQDEKTAMFAFDSFVYGTSEQVFNEDDSIKSDAYQYDTYLKLINAFNRIKAKGTVENVILDISLNGGGVVGVMMKLLALISKTNKGHLSFYDDKTSQVINYTARCDSNFDEKYDEEDCFGNEFKFYILTSDCSFSCGNAFPCIAQLKEDAKIIGQKSGGGECAVAIHYLPNSEYVYHSSNLHLGSFNDRNDYFIGFENGAEPDITIQTNESFYSIENLSAAIKNA